MAVRGFHPLITCVASYMHIDLLVELSETFDIGLIILDLEIVDVNAVGHIICRSYYVGSLDLNL